MLRGAAIVVSSCFISLQLSILQPSRRFDWLSLANDIPVGQAGKRKAGQQDYYSLSAGNLLTRIFSESVVATGLNFRPLTSTKLFVFWYNNRDFKNGPLLYVRNLILQLS